MTVTAWLHPICFAENCIAVDWAPTGRAKCADTGKDISKGEARLVMRLYDCQGNPKSTKIFTPSSGEATSFLSSLLDNTPGDSTASIEAFAQQLPDASQSDRTYIIDALSGRDVSSRRTPVSEAAAAAASKRKKKSQADSQASEPQAPKAKRPKKEAELEAEDGENGQVVD